MMFAILVVMAALVGCDSRPAQNPPFKPIAGGLSTDENAVASWGPDEYGVRCYSTSYRVLSCLKVK